MKNIFLLRSLMLLVLALTIALHFNPAGESDPLTADLLLGGISLASLIALVIVRQTEMIQPDPPTQEDEHEQYETETAGKQPAQVDHTTTELTPNVLMPDDLLTTYMHQFYERYKSFYTDVQTIPVEADEEQARGIRRQLVEMGLHAMSLSRAVRFGKLQRTEDEPNIGLIMENTDVSGLEKDAYRLYTEDPYITEKRFHILRKIFQDMDLGHLNAFAESVHISPEFLKKP